MTRRHGSIDSLASSLNEPAREGLEAMLYKARPPPPSSVDLMVHQVINSEGIKFLSCNTEIPFPSLWPLWPRRVFCGGGADGASEMAGWWRFGINNDFIRSHNQVAITALFGGQVIDCHVDRWTWKLECWWD